MKKDHAKNIWQQLEQKIKVEQEKAMVELGVEAGRQKDIHLGFDYQGNIMFYKPFWTDKLDPVDVDPQFKDSWPFSQPRGRVWPEEY